MADSLITLEFVEKIALVTLNRPDKRNAFDESMFASMEEISKAIVKEKPRVVVVTGQGDESFSSGFDVNPENPLVSDFLNAMDSGQEAPARKLIGRIRKAIDSFVSMPIPIIAAINGLAYGGGAELAVRCDMRVMDLNAEICFSEVKLGLMPDWGGGASLVHLVGSAYASDLILTARKINADEALRIGLINKIAAPGSALKESLRIAQKISENGPKAVRHSLNLIRESKDKTLSDSLALEADNAVSLIATGECITGITALLEKKKPEFEDE